MSVHAYVLCVCVHVTMHVCVRVHTCACVSRRRVQKAPIWFSVDEQEGPCRRVGRGSGPRPRRRREARWKAKERNASPADGIRGGPSECSAPGARAELRASRGSVADEQVRLRGDPRTHTAVGSTARARAEAARRREGPPAGRRSWFSARSLVASSPLRGTDILTRLPADVAVRQASASGGRRRGEVARVSAELEMERMNRERFQRRVCRPPGRGGL